MSISRIQHVNAWFSTGGRMAAVLLSLLSGTQVLCEVVKSDSVSIDFGGLKQTLEVVEVVVDGKESGESKLIFDLSKGVGFIGKNGYILICELPANPFGGCGPKNDFKGVSDLLAKGISAGNNNAPALFFFSGPFSENAPDDAASLLKELYKGQAIPDPLGPRDGILEIAGPQEVGKLFGFTDNKAIIITSDLDVKAAPEPGSLALLITGLVLAVGCRRRRS